MVEFSEFLYFFNIFPFYFTVGPAPGAPADSPQLSPSLTTSRLSTYNRNRLKKEVRTMAEARYRSLNDAVRERFGEKL